MLIRFGFASTRGLWIDCRAGIFEKINNLPTPRLSQNTAKVVCPNFDVLGLHYFADAVGILRKKITIL